MTESDAHVRSRFRVFVAAMLLCSSPPLLRAADEPSSAAIARAHGFLKSEKRGKFIHGYCHFGTQYDGHSYLDTRAVTSAGKTVPGHFALVYHLEWNGDGWTDIAFLCDSKGNIYDSRVLDHNGVVQQPYLVANATIQVLGNLLIEALKDQLTEADRKTIQTLVDNADAEGLMEFGLKLQQALE